MATKSKPAMKKPVKKTAPRAAKRAPTAKRAPAPKALPERLGLIEVGGKPATVIGNDVRVGQTAPAFAAQVGTWPGLATWAAVEPLKATSGKVRVFAAVPSLSTNTCDAETRRFNQEAASLSEDIRIVVVSADLPATQKHWCGAAGVERVMTVSDHLTLEFGGAYGTHVKERRWHRRAVFVVGKDDKVKYVAYMPALDVEPNYEEVLAAAKAALAE